MPNRNLSSFDDEPDGDLDRGRKLTQFVKDRLGPDDYDEFVALLAVGCMAGRGKRVGALDITGAPTIAAMDAALRHHRAREAVSAKELTDAHAASIGIKRPRLLGN